jgi:tetrahydromethanopterin S-methyltransferase subunit C
MGTYEREPVKGMAGAMFAAVMMLTLGVFQAIQGLVAIFNDDWYVRSAHYTFDLDVTTWGWIHLIIGILMAVAGWALFSGQLWAALTAMFLAFISTIDNFFFIPYYPFWSITIIALNIWVIWSLTRPGVIRD